MQTSTELNDTKTTSESGTGASPPSKRSKGKPRNDKAEFGIIEAVIGIAIFAAVIGFIGTQITQAGSNLTAFPGATTLLYLVPLILVAVLILRLWKSKGRSGGGRSRYN